ncbi:hypothetical protein FEM48_Zijuj10G0069200 [Ziziphus jujuba var. spinosa]|uniref:Uncharacterized protein n=1 Tax=Ziziphus jujuba var. spinosa TaxID=714518 RepID=A0A978ULZ1_ZIZJJ|nr:hypothetical protein FEM48_Zijuj10G0069200 [Ziziphus jujuba var. spinosa]
MNDQDDMSLVTRHASLSRACSNLIGDASLTVEGTKFLLNEIEMLRSKIKEMNGDGMCWAAERNTLAAGKNEGELKLLELELI